MINMETFTKIIIGDCQDKISELDDSSVDCVMTSPPYWNLRDYDHSDQLGLESTPEEYLENMLGVFDLIYPKLIDEGNCFVNIGDTYNGAKVGNTDLKNKSVNTSIFKKEKSETIPPKCLCMIPERFAWSMIEHGWILRNKIIWYKNNHQPEPVTDRLTKSYEMVYHFVKQKKYYYDLDAIREPHTYIKIDKKRKSFGKAEIIKDKTEQFSKTRNGRSRKDDYAAGGKNPGDMWQINTQPYAKAHFATFPLKLVEKPILAGCPIGGTVLDPFGGSGTVAEFCRKNERNCIIIELNPEYESLIEERSMVKTPALTRWL